MHVAVDGSVRVSRIPERVLQFTVRSQAVGVDAAELATVIGDAAELSTPNAHVPRSRCMRHTLCVSKADVFVRDTYCCRYPRWLRS